MEQRSITIRCACGWTTTGSEDEVVVATSVHGQRLHNMTPTRAEVLAMAVDGDRPSDRPAADRDREAAR